MAAPLAIPRSNGPLVIYGAAERVQQALRARAGRLAPGQAAQAGEVMLLDDFCQAVAIHALRQATAQGLDVWFRGRRRASGVELDLLVRRVLRDFYWHRGGVFYQVARRNGFVEALLRFFEECREGHVSEATLEEFLDYLIHEQGEVPDGLRVARLRELTRIFGRYERALAQLGWLDDGLMLRVALESVRDERFALPPLLDGGRVVFEDIYDWSPVRVDLVRELARRMSRERGQHLRFSEDHVEIHLPYDFDRPNLFHYLEPILRQIESLEGEALTIRWDSDGGLRTDVPREPALEALARSVWSAAGGVRSRMRGEDGETLEGLDPSVLTMIECSSSSREARAVARRARELLDGGAAPEQILIVVRELDEQLQPLGRALERYNISWSADWAPPLRSTPPARLVLSLLRMAQQGWPREDLIEVLGSHYTAGLAPTPGARGTQSAHAVARLLREAGIRDDLSATGSGHSAYQEHLDRHLARLQQRIQQERALRAQHGAARPEDKGPLEAVPEVSQARQLRDKVVALRRALEEAFPEGRRRLGEHAQALLELLERLKLRHCLAPEDASGGEDALEVELLRAQARDQRAVLALERLLRELIHSDAQSFELQDPQRQREEEEVPATVALERGRRRQFMAANLQEFLASAGFGDVQSLDDVEGTTWDVSLTLGEFSELMEHMLGQDHPGGPQGRGGRVVVVPVRHLAGCAVPHVILMGLNHGRFPLTYRSRALFPDEDRLEFGRFEAALNRRWGVERQRMSFPLQCLPYAAGTADDVPVPARQSEEVLLFYFALAAATRSLTLTWSNLDEAGRAWMRSVFVDEVFHRVPAAQRRQIIQREVLDPLPPLERCAARWEVVARYQLETQGDAVDPLPERPGAAYVRASVQRVAPYLGEVELAARVERARHVASAMDQHEIFSHLERAPLAHYLGAVGEQHRPWLAQALAFDAEHPLRVRALDRFGTCPSRFWFAEVMKLRKRAQVSQDVTAEQRAQVVQLLIQAAYDAIQGADLLPLSAADDQGQRRALRLAREAMAQALTQWERAHNRAHPRLWERVSALCREMVNQLLERERRMPPQKLVALPWRYGALWRENPRDSGPVEISLGPGRSVFLAGRIDRVSVGAGLSGGARLDLVTYGTGRVESYERRLSPERRFKTEHELPLSLLATAEGLVPDLRARGAVQEPVLITACYESVQEGRRTASLAAEVGAAQAREGDLLEAARSHLATTVEQMRGGCYPFATRDCSWCAYRDLCRRGTYPTSS